MTIKFDEAVKSFRSESVKFKQGKLTNVDSDSNQIVLEVPGQKTEKVDYDILILVTGASYVSPWRGQDDQL